MGLVNSCLFDKKMSQFAPYEEKMKVNKPLCTQPSAAHPAVSSVDSVACATSAAAAAHLLWNKTSHCCLSQAEGLSESAIKAFKYNFEKLTSGALP